MTKKIGDDFMAKTQAQKLAQDKYNAKAYDQILVRVKKGKREEYKESAAMFGIGLMELFRRGADEYIQNHPVEKGE